MTEAEKEDLLVRLDALHDDVFDVYVGDEQAVPTPYDEFLKEHEFLTGIPEEETEI